MGGSSCCCTGYHASSGLTKISKVGQEDWPKSAKNSKTRRGICGESGGQAASPRRVPGRRLCQNHSCVNPRISSHFSELSIYLSPCLPIESRHLSGLTYKKKKPQSDQFAGAQLQLFIADDLN